MRYISFTGESYYANGGFQDFACANESLDKCLEETFEIVKREEHSWFHAVDTTDMTVVAFCYGSYCGGENVDAFLERVSDFSVEYVISYELKEGHSFRTTTINPMRDIIAKDTGEQKSNS